MKITKYVPDFLTSMNLACGSVAIVQSFAGHFDAAFLLMLLAAVFDFCDGLAARALNAYSELGKELDSLADMVSFGVLPSMMLFNLMRACTFGENPLCYAALLIAVFSGIRLAKFNVDERQHENFIGLPTPACALICGSLCCFVAHEPASLPAIWSAGILFIPLLSLCLGLLLVCEIPMFSMKLTAESIKRHDAVFWKRLLFLAVALLCVAAVFLTGFHWSLAVLLVFCVYVLKNVVYAVFRI